MSSFAVVVVVVVVDVVHCTFPSSLRNQMSTNILSIVTRYVNSGYSCHKFHVLGQMFSQHSTN